MAKLDIFLKSGHTVRIECESWKFNYDPTTCEYTGYTLKGFKNISSFSCVPSQIAGFVELK